VAKGNPGHAPTVTSNQRLGQALSGLDRIRAAARQDKDLRFTNLMHHLTPELLHRAFRALRRSASPGVDGTTWHDYAKDCHARLPDLHDRVQQGTYRALPSRRVWIPKPNGEARGLGIAALEDKIVQQALAWILEAIYEQDFLGFSYGFRPGRRPHDALDALAVAIKKHKVHWVIDSDIRQFLDTPTYYTPVVEGSPKRSGC